MKNDASACICPEIVSEAQLECNTSPHAVSDVNDDSDIILMMSPAPTSIVRVIVNVLWMDESSCSSNDGNSA